MFKFHQYFGKKKTVQTCPLPGANQVEMRSGGYGWEVDDVTAYRTVRATPPPAPTREAIKTGKFDAVVFTSSSTVRNLVGIAGKPHASTVIAVIGPATAKTAEEHGLRVDVLAPSPSAETPGHRPHPNDGEAVLGEVDEPHGASLTP